RAGMIPDGSWTFERSSTSPLSTSVASARLSWPNSWMVCLPEDTSTWSFCGSVAASTEVTRFTFTPVWSSNFFSTSLTAATSVTAANSLNVMVVPARAPFAEAVVVVGDFLLHAAPTMATTATSATTAFDLDFIHPPPPARTSPRQPSLLLYVLRHSSSCRSSLHRSGQRPRTQVALQEVHDEQNGQSQDGCHGGHRLRGPPRDLVEHLQRQRQLVRRQ